MKINEYQKRNKKAFTLVEIMLLLVVLSLIMASSVSVISRKHKVKPRRAVHGQYICFYDQHRDASGNMVYDGKHEILMSGNTVLKNSTGVAQCSFKIPSSSSYIHVRLMGGGGAGGNANYSPNNQLKTEQKYINLVREYDSTVSSGYVRPKVTDGSSSNDQSKSGSSYMGISPSYVNKKFPADPISGCNSDDCALFSAPLFKYLINTFVVKTSFAYDYAGDAEGGNGILYNAFNYSSMGCPSLSGASASSFNQCLDNWVKGTTGTTPFEQGDLSMKCLTYRPSLTAYPDKEDFVEYCPLFFKEFYKPILGAYACAGGTAGKGSFIVAEKSGYDFYTFPVLGWRWPDYNIHVGWNTSNRPSYEDLCTYIKNYREPHTTLGGSSRSYLYVIDRLGCSFGDTRAYIPGYTNDSVVPAVAEQCVPGDICAVEIQGTKYKEAISNGWVNDSLTALVPIPKLSTGGKFDNTKWQLQEPVQDFDVGPYDGGYPYFDKHPVKSNDTTGLNAYAGVKLHYGESNIIKNWTTSGVSVLQSYLDRPYGKAGGSLTIDQKKSVWKDDGSNAGCPTGLSSGSNGTSSFKTTGVNLICINHLGFDVMDADIRRWTLNVGTTSYVCPPSDREVNHMPQYSDTLSESKIALNVTLYYYNKAISYGAPGKAGGYSEFFARSYKSNTIYVAPGKGGVARSIPSKEDLADIGLYANQAPGVAQNGQDTYLYYNCNASGCAYKYAAGGRGGGSGLWEGAEQLRYTGAKINQIINDIQASKPFIKCSYHAPAGECPATDASNKGEASPFAQIAPLLSLPGGLSLNLEQLGRGGDGGWVVDRCWVVPQFFSISWGSYMDSATFKMTEDLAGNYISYVLQNINDASLGSYGYTNLSKDNIDTCITNNKFTGSDVAYKETPGTDGMPGAVVITW